MSNDGVGWLEPFKFFADYLNDTLSMVALAHWGAEASFQEIAIIESMAGRDYMADALPSPEQKALTEKRASFARAEKEKGFPLLHGHSLVGMWGALEAFIEDVCVACMKEFPLSLDSEGLKKIKIPFSEFTALSEMDRLRFLVTELQRDRRTGLRSGVTAFEDLLKAIQIGTEPGTGLDGEVDSRVRGALYEAQQLRNVLAHRGGLADQRLCEACPGLELSPGQRVALDYRYITRVFFAMRLYASTIKNRILSMSGFALIKGPGIPGFENALDLKYPPLTESVKSQIHKKTRSRSPSEI